MNVKISQFGKQMVRTPRSGRPAAGRAHAAHGSARSALSGPSSWIAYFSSAGFRVTRARPSARRANSLACHDISEIFGPASALLECDQVGYGCDCDR